MKQIQGKFNSAKVFTDTIDAGAEEQIRTLCDQEFTRGSSIRIMPDVHAGAGCTIGTTMTVKDRVVPNLVGVDIGCGMITYVLKEKEIDLEKLDRFIYSSIPAGMNIRPTPHPYIENINLKNLKCLPYINEHRAVHALGSLGGGNHFIEVDRDENGNICLVIHSGSRYLGKQVAEYYQEEAGKQLSGNARTQIEETIRKLKEEGRQNEIQSVVGKLKKQSLSSIPKALAYLEGSLFDDYIHDMKIVQEYAVYNRKAMADAIVACLGAQVRESFTTIHNYIDTETMILRKGAVSAKEGEKILIPINMRDGSLLVSTDEVRIENLKVSDVVALGRAPYTNWVGTLTEADRARVDHALRLVGMEQFARKGLDTLSDGERQRVMIARALAQDTPIILLDEPTAFLDLPNKYEIGLLLRELAHKEGKSILFSTHDLNVALELCDTIAMIDEGHFLYGTTEMLIDSGDLERLFRDSALAFDPATRTVRLRGEEA